MENAHYATNSEHMHSFAKFALYNSAFRQILCKVVSLFIGQLGTKNQESSQEHVRFGLAVDCNIMYVV